uniref:Uncharacterized protein n=1 Tax=Panagrolaimus davidi TaxID=227884 RepID=A0A914QQI8_9BILA
MKRTPNESTLSSSQVEKSPSGSKDNETEQGFGVSKLRDQEQKSSNDSIIDHDFGSGDSFSGSAFFSQVEKSPEQSDNAAQNSADFGAPEHVYHEQNIANNSYRDNTFNGDFGNETFNESTLSSSQVEKSPEQGYNAARFGVSELRDQELNSSNGSIIDHDFGNGDSGSSQVEKSPAVQNSLNGTIILGDTPLSTFGMNRTIVISPSPLEPVPKRRRITRNQKAHTFQQNNPVESFNDETDVEESFVSKDDNLDDSDYRPENEKKFIAEQRYFRGSSSKFGGEIPSQALESPFNRSDRCYCTKSLCQTRKCGCKKAGRRCNIYCHRKEDYFNDCLNH